LDSYPRAIFLRIDLISCTPVNLTNLTDSPGIQNNATQCKILSIYIPLPPAVPIILILAAPLNHLSRNPQPHPRHHPHSSHTPHRRPRSSSVLPRSTNNKAPSRPTTKLRTIRALDIKTRLATQTTTNARRTCSPQTLHRRGYSNAASRSNNRDCEATPTSL